MARDFLTRPSAVVGFVRTMGKLVIDDKITLNAICPGIVRTAISTGDFHDKAEEKGLLVGPKILIESFESLLGTNTTSGETIEVLPDGYLIKKGAEYTNERCKESVEMTYQRTLKAKAS